MYVLYNIPRRGVKQIGSGKSNKRIKIEDRTYLNC
ncbi:MAG: hypothetical protein ACI90V_013112, partial [Bacillariaceae sp.]